MKLDPRYLALFCAALALSAAAARAVEPERRSAFLAAIGLVFMAAFLSPAMAALLALLAWAVRSLLRPPAPARRVAAASVLAFAGGVPLVYGGFFLRYDAGRLSASDWVRALFLVNYLRKLIYFIYESASGTGEPLDGGEFLSYFFAIPSMLGLGVVVSPAHWRESRGARTQWESLRRGLATLAFSVLHLLALGVLLRWVGGWILFGPRLDATMASWPWRRSWALFIGNYIGFYLLRYGGEQSFIGSSRLLGWDLRDNYEAPLAAPDYAEHWRRWNTHSRDLLLSMFYFPAALAFARRFSGKPEWTAAAAGLATFFGSGVFNFLMNAVFLPPRAWASYVLLAEQLALYEAFQWTMVTAATLARLRRRAAGEPEPGPARRALGAGAAIALRGFSLPLLKSRPAGWRMGVWLFRAAV